MADIKDQLIKDSYNYVLQSDLSTGIVYRIGGSIPVNPIFYSGLTINDSFTYSNGTEQNGYALLTDGTGYAYWGPVSGASSSSGNYLPLSGGTVYGNTIFTSGLTASTLTVTGLTQTSGITSTGGITFPQRTINGSYTAVTSDYMIDITGGTFNVQLPTAVGIQGKLLSVKNNGGGAVTVLPFGSEKLDDKNFLILSETNSVQLVSNGNQWIILGQDRSTVNNSTGVFEFSGMSRVSNTQFSVSRVRGWITDTTTNPLSPQIYYVDYSGGTHTDNYVTTAFETFVYLTSGATIQQQPTPLTEKQRRQNIFLGKIGHPQKTAINLVFSQPDYVLSPLAQLRDMFVPINLINGGVYPSPNGANLKFNTSAGFLYGLGINFASDSLNPNALTISGGSPTTFQYRTSTGGTVVDVTDINPTIWDVNGVATPISGTKSTNQRIYLLQNGTFRVQYGQTEYNQLSAAIAGIQTETFTVFPNFTNNAVLIGILSITSSCTDLTDTTKAQFFLVSKFGETVGAAGGIGTTTLQQAYNNSSEPEILINSTLDGLSIKNGTGNADNTTSLSQGLNAAGTVTSFIRADGLFSGSSISTPILSGNSTQLIVSGDNSSDLVRITQTGTGNALIVEDSSNPDSTPFVVAADGRVGIGVTAPLSTYKLHVRNGTATNSSAIAGSTGVFESSGATYVTVLSPDASNSGISFGANSDRFGAFMVWNHNANRLSISTDKTDGFIALATGDQSERMRIDSTGNVGIGTTTPSQKLHVSGDTFIQGNLTANTISATTYFNLPSLYQLTGGTYSAGTIDFKNTTGGTSFSVTGLSKYFVTGSTPSGITLSNGDRWFDTNTGIEVVWITDNDGSQWIQPTQGGGGSISGNYLPLSGGTVTGGTIFQGGLTANTISATTYQNLPISGVTNGTGISTSITNGNVTITNTAPDQTVTINSGTDISVSGTYPDFTIDYTGTGGGGTTLIASNSCVIPADDITYYGATIGGWGFFNWDVSVKNTISPSLVNLGIPLPENLRGGDTISVCGIAFNNATEPDSDNFDVRLDFFQCDNYSIIPLGDVSYLYGTDGVVCFNLYIELNRNLNACDTFLLLGFTSTTSDATQIKISYTVKTPGTNR